MALLRGGDRVHLAVKDRPHDRLEPILDMLHVHLGWPIPSAHRTENMVIGLRMAMLAPEHVEHCHLAALTDKGLYAAHGKNMLLDRQLVGILGLCLFWPAPPR